MNSRIRTLLKLALLTTALTLIGCGSGSDDDSGSDNPSWAGSGPIFVTPLGTIEGFVSSADRTGAIAEIYLGIPYAEPPVGARRWKAPQVAGAWHDGYLNATRTKPGCPVANDPNTSEDCLYANIYRPVGTDNASRLPVMVYAYGGGNTGGSANSINGTRMAAFNGILVVTFNYRIGALGFLALPEMATVEGYPVGNYGVLDTRAVLQWVKNNIAAFGGDPDNVTLASQSSGSTNTCRLLVDPAAAGLFHAAIIASDDCIHDVDNEVMAVSRSRELASQLNCNQTDPYLKVQCMRNKTAQEILQARVANEWNPVSPSTVKHGWAVELIEEGTYPNKVPVLVGSTRDEGRQSGRAFIDINNDLITLNPKFATRQAFADWAYYLLNYSAGYSKNSSTNADQIVNKYMPPQPSSAASAAEVLEVGYAYGDFITDSGMRGLGGCTNLRLAEALANNVPTYFYQFDYKAETPLAANVYDDRASHGSDVKYLWHELSRWNPTPYQLTLSEQMIRYWGAFAKNHDPNVDGQTYWPMLSDSRNTSEQMQLRRANDGGLVTQSLEEFSRQHNCNLWLKDYDLIITDRGNPGYDITKPPVTQLCHNKTTQSCK